MRICSQSIANYHFTEYINTIDAWENGYYSDQAVDGLAALTPMKHFVLLRLMWQNESCFLHCV